MVHLRFDLITGAATDRTQGAENLKMAMEMTAYKQAVTVYGKDGLDFCLRIEMIKPPVLARY